MLYSFINEFHRYNLSEGLVSIDSLQQENGALSESQNKDGALSTVKIKLKK